MHKETLARIHQHSSGVVNLGSASQTVSSQDFSTSSDLEFESVMDSWQGDLLTQLLDMWNVLLGNIMQALHSIVQ